MALSLFAGKKLTDGAVKNRLDMCRAGSGKSKALNLAIGIGNAAGAMFGFGVKSPLQALQEDIAGFKYETQEIINESATQFAQLQGAFNNEIFRVIMRVNSTLQQSITIGDTILNQKTLINQMYIYGSYILSICIIIALYFTKSFLR